MNTKFHPANFGRADRGMRGLQGYLKPGVTTISDDTVRALICDLGHYCNRHGLDFMAELRLGIAAWSNECANPVYGEGTGPEPLVFIAVFTPPTPQQLANKFADVLREWLTPSQWELMCDRNRAETWKGACRSHDFCDANMAMDAAWQSFGLPSPDADDQAQADLWNAAWKLAFEQHLSGPSHP